MSTGTAVAWRPSRARTANLRRAAEHSIFGVVPVVVTLALFAFQLHLHALALDFQLAYRPAVHRLLHDMSPYLATQHQVRGGTAFVYPAVAALLLAPFGVVSNALGQILYACLCLACVPAILRALNVRDWRVYGLSLLWFPVFDGWESGNVTLPLALLVALAWRHRNRPVMAGLLTALAISVKVFVWPLALWLVATRRWRASAMALVWGLALNLLAWAVVGFNQIGVFLHLSAQDTAAVWRGGYSLMAIAHHLGLGRAPGEVLLVAVAAVGVAAVLYVGLIKRRDRHALAIAVGLMLVASPLLWAHYFALLLIPLGLLRPRLSLVWAVPVLMWPMPPRQPVYGWEELLAWGAAAAILTSLVRGHHGQVAR